MLDSILFIIGIFFAGFHAGQFYAVFKIKNFISDPDNLQKIRIQLESNNNQIAELSVENYKDKLYLFDQKTNTFICQADTLEELAYLASTKNNINKATVFNQSNQKLHKFIDGKVYES